MKSGLAKASFFETYQRSPWNLHQKKFFTHSWPLLDACLAQRRIAYLDYILTHRLLRQHINATQELAFCLCHLIIAAREGHLCIHIGEQQLLPSASQLWQEEGSTASREESEWINALIRQGIEQIPTDLITHLTSDQIYEGIDTPFCRYRTSIYLQRHWIFESLFLHHLKRHCISSPVFVLNTEKIETTLSDLCQQGHLLEEQAQAVRNACLHPFSLMTGGPGTGKTYTAGQFIKVFWTHLPPSQREKCEIALAAPTGKAVANLQRSLGKVSATLEKCPPLIAKTLHNLLGIRSFHHPFSTDGIKRLTADLIVVDECSMIDIRLMALLFEAIKEGARLVLIGDCHQLPSVEAGSIFADLLHVSKLSKELSIPCTQLKTCVRTDIHSIIDFAKMIKQGEAEAALKMLNTSSCQEIQKLSLPVDIKEAHRVILNDVKKHFPIQVKKGFTPQQILQLFQTTRILSPLRKGPLGVEALNHLLWNYFSQIPHRGEFLAIPIMIVMNDYRQNLFNGETGVLIRRTPLRGICTEDYGIFPDRDEEGQVRKIAAILLPKYEYAYCLSVHKSQGSEFDRVVLIMPEGSELFGREVLYTAVTRARKHVTIYGKDSVLHQTILHQGIRLSGISQRLVSVN